MLTKPHGPSGRDFVGDTAMKLGRVEVVFFVCSRVVGAKELEGVNHVSAT